MLRGLKSLWISERGLASSARAHAGDLLDKTLMRPSQAAIGPRRRMIERVRGERGPEREHLAELSLVAHGRLPRCCRKLVAPRDTGCMNLGESYNCRIDRAIGPLHSDGRSVDRLHHDQPLSRGVVALCREHTRRVSTNSYITISVERDLTDVRSRKAEVVAKARHRFAQRRRRERRDRLGDIDHLRIVRF